MASQSSSSDLVTSGASSRKKARISTTLKPTLTAVYLGEKVIKVFSSALSASPQIEVKEVLRGMSSAQEVSGRDKTLDFWQGSEMW